MRVLFADKLAPLAKAALEGAGHAVVIDSTLDGDALTTAIAHHQPDVLVVRSTKVKEAHLAACTRLSLVIRAGAGVNTIDLDAAGRLGVFVSNCPGKNAEAVAELTLGLLVAVDRQIPDNVAAARAGRWEKGRFSKADGLAGRTLGLIGFGAIAQAVARVGRALGMRIVAWSRSLDDATAAAHGVTRLRSPLEVAGEADAVSLHVALVPATRGLVDATFLAAMKDGATLLNTARAELVDEAALLAALDAGRLRAGLDVLADEPPGNEGVLNAPLARHPGVALTHHIGASTSQAQDAVAAEVVRILHAYAATGSPPGCVNLLTASSADHVLIVRHRDRVGVLASVLDCLRRANLNVQEMANTIFQGEAAAVARIQVNGDPTTTLGELERLEHVLHVTSVPIQRGAP